MTAEWNAGWPGWRDDGRTVEIELEDGTTLVGELCHDDTGRDEDGEFPLWLVDLNNGLGERVEFTVAERWRFVE